VFHYLAEYLERLAKQWLLLAFLLLDLAGLAALEFPVLRDVAPLQPYLLGAAVVIVLVAGFAVFREERELRARSEARVHSRLVVQRHGVDMAEARPGAHGSTGWDYFVRVFVANEPRTPDASAVARSVTASLLVYQRGSANLIFDRAPLPIRAGEDDNEVLEVDMPPTGRPYALDVMRKPIRERECYFWDSRFRTQNLGPGEFDVVLVLRGIDTHHEFEFTLRNPDSDGPPQLEYVRERNGARQTA
jgi:hypothetical protein